MRLFLWQLSMLKLQLSQNMSFNFLCSILMFVEVS